jgi:hypothetical protein
VFGLKIVPHLLAVKVSVKYNVRRWGTGRKKRRGWCVERVEKQQPCAFQAGSTVYMHPDLYEQLKVTCSEHPASPTTTRAIYLDNVQA